MLERSIAAAKALGTDRVRCFDFWRLDDPKPFRDSIDGKLRDTAAQVASKKITLLLENEFACNTATGAEAVRTLQAVQSPNFKLNWDPGNAAYRGEIAFPNGFEKIPKERIGHMHCKDVVRNADGTYEWAAMGRGIIDYVGQFRATDASGVLRNHEPRNALERRGLRGRIFAPEHGGNEGTPEQGTRSLSATLRLESTTVPETSQEEKFL